MIGGENETEEWDLLPAGKYWGDCVFADDSNRRGWLANGAYQISQQPHGLDLIAEWADEPAAPQPAGTVRIITRKEVVSGVYGAVVVSDNGRLVRVGYMPDAATIRAAIATLSEIADAMEENSK